MKFYYMEYGGKQPTTEKGRRNERKGGNAKEEDI